MVLRSNSSDHGNAHRSTNVQPWPRNWLSAKIGSLKICARRRGRRALDPGARGDVRGCRIIRPIERDRPFRSIVAVRGARGAPGGRSRRRWKPFSIHASRGLRADGRFRRRSIARSRSSAVGSSQNGSENASLTSARVRPISASMRRSRPASCPASRRWRRACASALSQWITKASKDAKTRSKVPAAIGKTRDNFALMSVSIQICGLGAR